MSANFSMNSMLRVCAKCGKELPVHDIHNYQWRAMVNGRRVYFCSYTCYQKHQNWRNVNEDRGDAGGSQDITVGGGIIRTIARVNEVGADPDGIQSNAGI